MHTHVVIMAGGIGSRFWPMSTPDLPKQFVDIMGIGKTLIQMTVERFSALCPMSNFWVVTGEKYVDLVKEQLPQLPWLAALLRRGCRGCGRSLFALRCQQPGS